MKQKLLPASFEELENEKNNLSFIKLFSKCGWIAIFSARYSIHHYPEFVLNLLKFVKQSIKFCVTILLSIKNVYKCCSSAEIPLRWKLCEEFADARLRSVPNTITRENMWYRMGVQCLSPGLWERTEGLLAPNISSGVCVQEKADLASNTHPPTPHPSLQWLPSPGSAEAMLQPEPLTQLLSLQIARAPAGGRAQDDQGYFRPN